MTWIKPRARRRAYPAGVVTVGLMIAFFAGVGLFIWRDAQKKR